ncbi:hypothetical protein B0H34DRAFT_674688 [Crassisporium funariophilum]|nr:hypothetical protein B0H34DRAFT_674688 [Crassisporium funariophilum]
MFDMITSLIFFVDGYLTRTLKYHLPDAHILALDADQEQTNAAQRWEHRLLPHASPPIAHKTILLSPQTLLTTITEWVQESTPTPHPPVPVPVLLVALHACGSLTPDILRAFLASLKPKSPNPNPTWTPIGTIAVGCCYNLMTASDFPLSKHYAQKQFQHLHHLPPSAFHLASQVPGQWLQQRDPPIPKPSVALAVRKVAWRAMLGRALLSAIPVEAVEPESLPAAPHTNKNKGATVPARWLTTPEQDDDPDPTPRLGRLPSSAYHTYPHFLLSAQSKLHLLLPASAFAERGAEEMELERRVEVLHVIRCLVGAGVEDVILMDRVRYLFQVGITVGQCVKLKWALVKPSHESRDVVLGAIFYEEIDSSLPQNMRIWASGGTSLSLLHRPILILKWRRRVDVVLITCVFYSRISTIRLTAKVQSLKRGKHKVGTGNSNNQTHISSAPNANPSLRSSGRLALDTGTTISQQPINARCPVKSSRGHWEGAEPCFRPHTVVSVFFWALSTSDNLRLSKQYQIIDAMSSPETWADDVMAPRTWVFYSRIFKIRVSLEVQPLKVGNHKVGAESIHIYEDAHRPPTQYADANKQSGRKWTWGGLCLQGERFQLPPGYAVNWFNPGYVQRARRPYRYCTGHSSAT